MIQPIVILFVIIAFIFAVVHAVAVAGSFYWHYWWFDIVMHFWGGLLIALGVVSLTTFRRISITPSYKLILGVTLFIVLAWEFFEWQVGLFVPALHLPDAIYDVTLGLSGGLLGYWVIRHFKI
jgi:glycopeptide antibiotics resistance protein